MKKRTTIVVNSLILPVSICVILLIGPVSQANAGWEQANKILSRIKAPQFPNRDFNITDYGAVGDGKTNCTEAINKAISAANEAGGGRVVVPAGTFLTGAIYLKSNVNLYVSEGAVIKFSTDPNAYLPAVFTRWEGVECMNYSPLIYAYKEKNIAITGKGTLDGQGQNWWSWKKLPQQREDRKQLFEQGRDGVPVKQRLYGGKLLRPNMIEPYKCKNILIEGIKIKNGPFWHIHPVLSQNITVRNVRVDGSGPNNDGCDPESCKDVLIEGCYFNTGDDCIAIKSGRNNDARRVNVPSENIIIRNCEMKEGHAGVAIGSEITGGARNIFVENCIMDDPNQDRAIRLKTNSVRGGFIENVYVRNVTIGQVKEAVLLIDFFYQDIEKGNYKPRVRNINMENVTSKKSKYALFLRGLDNAPIRDVRLKNCTLDNVETADVISNVKNLVMENVKINGKLVKTDED
ncbi:MAG: glycoside hydrolase family 28 protein [Phycisphaerae bacterium]|nr:glycoside hydrolase family 28 protein [Phycisphaerae bacterium]